MKKRGVRIIIILASILTLIVLVISAIYLWPLRSSVLQAGTSETISYQQSLERFSTVRQLEDERNVTKECQSKALTHGDKTAKAVVMFHGVTACTKQFDGLAKIFFDAGYNVYIPSAPHHGTSDKKAHSQVRSQELVDYVNASISIATGLGDELGVVGLSGGGMLSTWAAEYRSEVKHALILSPFYEPSATQAPKWQLPFLNVLYGFHIVPDMYSAPDTSNPSSVGFSYRALAAYNIVTKNLKKSLLA